MAIRKFVERLDNLDYCLELHRGCALRTGTGTSRPPPGRWSRPDTASLSGSSPLTKHLFYFSGVSKKHLL